MRQTQTKDANQNNHKKRKALGENRLQGKARQTVLFSARPKPGLADRVGVHQAALVPQVVDAAWQTQGRLGADVGFK